jgi:3-phenylpropionate/trans-cinnamate dioxygenase ferredoxin subunit
MGCNWVDVASSAAVGDRAPLEVEVGGVHLVVVRCGKELHAVEDRCTHDGEALGAAEVADCEIICPRHGARFCLRSGEALTPPAYEPLRTYRVREQDGRVLVESPA